MEYQMKKTQILAKVQFNNLLSFSLVQNKLERNFRTIVEALMLNQQKTQALNIDHIDLKEQHTKQTARFNSEIQQIRKQLEELKNRPKNNENNPLSNEITNVQSHHDIKNIASKKIIDKLQNPSQNSQSLKHLANSMSQQMKNWENLWSQQKNNLLKQIEDLKNKLDNVGFLQSELNTFRIDLRLIKQQTLSNLKNNSSRSSKNFVKRQSILSMAANKNTERNMQKSKNDLKQLSKNSIKVLISEDNKQNSPTIISQENIQNIQHKSADQNIQKQINSLYLELNTLKISFQQLRDMLSDNKKQVYRSNSLLTQVKDDLSRQIKTRKNQNEEIEKTIKQMKIQMLNIQTLQNPHQNLAQQQKGLRQSVKTSKGSRKQDDEGNMNYKNQLNDKMSRMQAMIQNLITQTQFSRFKNQVNQQLEKITGKVQNNELNLQNTEKKLEQLIFQGQSNANQQIELLKNNINSLYENLKNQTSQNERKNNILQAKLEELKKSLQNLREDMEFYQSMMNQNNGNSTKNEKKIQENQIPHTENKQKTSLGLDQKSLEALKKYFNGKMHDLRTNLLGLVRDLEKKLNNKSNGQNQVIKIWDKLNELKLFMNKKADQDDAKKTYLYLQKKINRLNAVLLKNQDNTEDARIARSNNWHCLSCDKNLQSYQGKIGKHIVWDSMPLKGINKSVVNLQDQKKKGLPQLKK